ncbi:MAG: DUF3800 domain-containing protein [Candidatus Melainabacteria bacterium]|nr:DUF3800 domain-containing protein [Candidatus Melainabacteria bacterium]
MNFSDYIVYVDESGDHDLTKADPSYPVFVLAFCIVKKTDYYQKISPSIQQLKFDFFGHDIVILHEREIRQSEAPFDFLLKTEYRHKFMEKLNQLIEQAPMTIISTVIKKDKLTETYRYPDNPYHLAMKYCMERLYHFLKEVNQHTKITHVVFEKRGNKEDQELELEFRRVCEITSLHTERDPNLRYPFDIIIADKRINSGGLQLADLIARPIGRHVINPQQSNRAYEILSKKFYQGSTSGFKYSVKSGARTITSKKTEKDWGLKIFPH